MTNSITKRQKCIMMRSGLEIWLDEDKAIKIENDLIGGKVNGFFRVENRMINAVDIAGIFTPQDLDEFTRRRLGQWKCEYGVWHPKNDICQCGSNASTADLDYFERIKKESASPETAEKEMKKIRKQLQELADKKGVGERNSR